MFRIEMMTRLTRFIITAETLLLVLSGVFIFYFTGQKESPKPLASFSLQFQGDEIPKTVNSSAYAVAYTDAYTKLYHAESFGMLDFHNEPLLLIAILGTKNPEKGRDFTLIDKSFPPDEEGNGMIMIGLKKPEQAMLDSGGTYICDLGLDTICQVAFDKGYFQQALTLLGPRFLANEGMMTFAFKENRLIGEVKNGLTNGGAVISGTFAIPVDYGEITGKDWSPEDLAQAKNELSKEEALAVREAMRRDKQRILDINTLQYALSIYEKERGSYPLAEPQHKIEKTNLASHPLYQALTSDPKYNLPKDKFPVDPLGEPFFYMYGTVENGRGYLLTAALEAVKDPKRGGGLCNTKISTQKCIYSQSSVATSMQNEPQSSQSSGSHGNHK